jgi:hypothetical protein
MVGVPTAIPPTTPELLTDPWVGLLLVQVPPAVASARAVVDPIQTLKVPVIGETVGSGFTVMVCVTVQPDKV